MTTRTLTKEQYGELLRLLRYACGRAGPQYTYMHAYMYMYTYVHIYIYLHVSSISEEHPGSALVLAYCGGLNNLQQHS